MSFKIFLNLLTVSLFVSCLKFGGDSSSSSSNPSNTIPTTNPEEILKTFKGGTVDIRNTNTLKISGTIDQKKLLETQITLLGNGKVILSSDKAVSFIGDGKKIILGARNFSHFVIEEYRLGKSVKSTIKNSNGGLEYRLKL